MPSASAYLDRFCDFLERHVAPFAESPVLEAGPLDQRGVLAGRLRFPDGCTLHVELTVVCVYPTLPAPVWLEYRFHLQDSAGRCIVRLDNAAHHPVLATFPHHAHRGPTERVEPHAAPSGRGLVREVLREHGGHGAGVASRPARHLGSG